MILAERTFESYGVTASEVLNVFHRYFADEMSTLRELAAADRNDDERLRRLDFNPLVKTPFVSMGDGRYLAPNMYLVAQRISLTSMLYSSGTEGLNKAFSRDLGKLTEAYVGDQLRLLAPAALTGERTYKVGKDERLTSDFVLKFDDLTVVFEVKSARVAYNARLNFDAYVKDFERDVGKALDKQIKTTVDLIRIRHDVFVDLELPMDVCGVVVTAEPHYMLNSARYRQRMPDPGCPFAVVSLGELEFLVAAAQTGGAAYLFRALTR